MMGHTRRSHQQAEVAAHARWGCYRLD